MERKANDKQKAAEKISRPKLIQSFIDIGGRAFSPDATSDSRQAAQREFDDLLERTRTLALIGALSILIRPGSAPPWLRAKLKETLAEIPLRPDGVRSTLEFVFSVHPSSTVRASEAAIPQKRGANITQEALQMASQLIASPAASIAEELWYSAISPQLLVLLDGDDGPELVKTVSYIIGFGILGRKASGAPGTLGWRYLAEPMLSRIRPLPNAPNDGPEVITDEIIDLSKEKVIITFQDLATALHRLFSIVVSHPNPGLCKRLLAPLPLQLWALSSWQSPSLTLKEKICTPASELLKTFLKLVSSPGLLLLLVRNVGYIGGEDPQNPDWVYKETSEGQVQIVATNGITRSGDASHHPTLQEIDQKIPKLLDLITASFSDANISTTFLDLLGRWLKSAGKRRGENVLLKQETDEGDDPMTQLAELRVLQSMMDRFADKLANQPKHILELVGQLLVSPADAPDDDEEVNGVALSLVNMIITVPGFMKSRVDPDVLRIIESSLDKLSRREDADIARTANSLSLLLKHRDEVDAPSGNVSAPTARQIEDRKTYSLARSYLSQSDALPPIKMEGLNLIANLIVSQSPILDIPGILVLMSSLMSDNEDYINLQVIKIFTLLASRHPKSVTTELLDHFVDPKETESVDSRLRFGEALSQVIEWLGETFSGETAQQVGDALLSVAGRRGHRPKTEAKQAREERARQLKNKEALDVWDGDIPDLSDDTTTVSEEAQARNEILSRIVSGWESKRGAEDVRIRTSALSILGNAIETNIAGLGPILVSTAVDLCVNVLQLERDMEHGILRRAAVLLVLSFVRALDAAKQAGKRLGFGLAAQAQDDIVRTLGYIAETDNDGLVQQHARDVIESLQNWQVAGLVPSPGERLGQQQQSSSGLTKLAGLNIDAERSVSLLPGGSTPRPRIEEIE
ncbi:hypothetical protein B0H63DRAFT_468819 [Podospora didyma]|uniref:RNA polymerase II assembly factor RTP1 n=1 Tax=Podospora didyma TaxID=330526 RepID=A0AAE0NT06_9PEZI|nr:hypothetical protein B0H63DRAFT_468819 [Podospora didyma]